REILSQQAVGVLVATALPRTAWIAEIDLHVGGDGEVLVVSHLLASIPGQGAAQLLGQFAHVFTERGYYGRRVLARDFEKHHKAGMALDQRRDVGVVCSGEKVSFPVAWHGAIVGLGRPLADGSRIDDLSQSALAGAAFGLAHLPRCTQVRHQRLLQHAACLDKETPIDRFVRYLHAWVGRELPLQPARDLLSGPREREFLRDAPSWLGRAPQATRLGAQCPPPGALISLAGAVGAAAAVTPDLSADS